jgi:hypothetical protein
VFKPEEVVGKTASVIAPMSKGALGEIVVAGRSLTARPISPDLVLATGDIVVIKRIDGTIASVDKESGEESSTNKGEASDKESNENIVAEIK